MRVVGCLRDDETSLFALLFITELFDYMPINPNLTDSEIAHVVDSSGADCAILSSEFLANKGHLFQVPRVVDWDALVTSAWQGMTSGAVPPRDALSAHSGRLILHTSGSTGLPKRVPIRIDAINASARNIAAGHQLSSQDHALNALPTFHIGALVDVLLAPLSVGGAVSITDKRAPEQLAHEIIAKRPTWIQIVPTILRRMVEDLDPDVIRDAATSLTFIRSIAAPVPADLRQSAEDLFGCPVVEMYGMTETAGQIATNGRDPKSAKPGSVGKPVGVSVAIMDGFGNPVEAGKVGEVCVTGPTVFDGYEGMAREEVFFDALFRTGDLGVVDDDGYLFLRGRLKEMINVGGEKVSPHEIETAALLMPDIIEAAAYALPHPSLGEQVGLTVATRAPHEVAQVKQFLATRLADFKCPNAVSVVDQLPRLANAKVDRVLLKREGTRAWLERTGGHAASDVSLSPEAKAVATQWARILKCRVPAGDDDFFDMGGDSLSATQLLLSLETKLKRSISSNQLFENPTFSGLVASLSDAKPTTVEEESRAIRYVRQNMAGWPGRATIAGGLMHGVGSLKSGAPLFWASQGAGEIQPVVDTLGQKRPVYFSGSLYRFKKRDVSDFDALARQLAREIDTIQPSGSISLGGFCGGASVMLHTADQLRDMGRDIRVFISFDFWPDRQVNFPTIHCMSKCKKNSARNNFAHYDLALDLVHPIGAQILNVDSDHRFAAIDLAPHVAVLNGAIDGAAPAVEAGPTPATGWDLARRMQPPGAKIKILDFPLVYERGARRTVRIAVQNTSQQVWEPTATSGLSVQVDLLNLDNHLRTACAGYASFDRKIAPSEVVELSFELSFPDKRLPLWISCCLVSQGVMRFTSKSSGARKVLVMPNVLPSLRVPA
ncbi:AMP-binding protein [Tateyamaria sp. SN3-11]|uniref:AMP-binding protein n=1 Tax=Tateyamaria sp. SN3-11 TaxID=3092147 RepID=UPI0039ECEE5A